MPIGDVDPEEYLMSNELKELEKVFYTYDKDRSGAVSSSELQPMFASIGMSMKPYQIDAIVREYDLDNSGEIDLEEFLVMMIKLMGKRVRIACINYKEYLTDEMIEEYEKAFRHADMSGEGSLNCDEVRIMLKNLGILMDKKQLQELFDEVDRDGSGQVEFDEYCSMMVKLTGVRKRINAREYISKEDINHYRAAFDKFDSSGDGTISSKELDALLRRMGLVLRIDQVEALMAKFDANQSGELDFTEFLSIMVDVKKLRRMRKINPYTTTARTLKEEGFSATEVKGSGFPAAVMRQDGFRAAEMHNVFKPLELRHAGYSARDMRGSRVGVTALRRVGYSATDLRNAGYSSRSIAAMNKRLHGVDKTAVPHYSLRRAQTAPSLPGQSTPRLRHFADDQVLQGNRTRGLLKMKVKDMAAQTAAIRAFGGMKPKDKNAKAPKASKDTDGRPQTAPDLSGGGAVDSLSANLGLTKNVTAVGVGGGIRGKK